MTQSRDDADPHYRVRGHLAADLDPLGLAKRELPPTSRLSFTVSREPRSTARSISAA
jgi:2-oxoglutarate dehydrogenase complex dehydrogenase (E1) component-like enzyme